MGQAQGTHNAAEEVTKLEPPDRVLLEENSGRTYWDAPLTAKGQAQAAALRRSLQAERRLSPPAAASGGADGGAVPRLELVVSSTLRRALETATIVFDTASRNSKPAGVRWVATELCRERVANFTCDGRSDRSALEDLFPHFDFGEVAEEADPQRSAVAVVAKALPRAVEAYVKASEAHTNFDSDYMAAKHLETVEIVHWQEVVDEGQGGPHAARLSRAGDLNKFIDGAMQGAERRPADGGGDTGEHGDTIERSSTRLVSRRISRHHIGEQKLPV